MPSAFSSIGATEICADLTPADKADLETGHRFASLSDANRFVARLEQAHEAMAGTTTTTGPAPESPSATETTR